MSDEIKYSPNMDVNPVEIKDIVPEKMIKVYPYEFVNASSSKAFLQQQSVSVATISQNSLDTNDENLLQDNNGDKYFEMFAAITSEGKMDLSSATSVYGLELKEEDSFSGISNWYYEGEFEDIKIGDARLMPAMFSIGKPFDETEYEKGKQALFIPASMIEAKEGTAHISGEINPEGLYEFNLINIKALESSFTNSRLIFTKSININKDVKNSNGKSGITIGMDSRTLLSSIKIKGNEKLDLGNGNFELDVNTDIDIRSKKGLMPFKMTPTSVQDKLSMYADWFDYDTVLPYAYISKFLHGATLDKAITNKVDLNMVKDMILFSYLFSTEFADVPLLQGGTNGDSGKIDPTYVLGTIGISAAKIAGKDPLKVIDGIYEKHIREYPGFLQDHTRYQPAQGIINALCRYISSSHTIGKGNNAFGWAYLPWYLTPLNGITTVVNKNHKSILLTKDLEYVAQSIYFSKNYGNQWINKSPNNSAEKLVVPNNPSLSDQILLQTDRKLTVPEVPYMLHPLNKLPLPGDINTKSSQDLMYMWWLPINDQSIMEKIMLDKLKGITVIQPNTEFTVNIPETKLGKTKTKQQIMDYLSKHYPHATIIGNVNVTQKLGPNVTVTRIGEGSHNDDKLQIAGYNPAGLPHDVKVRLKDKRVGTPLAKFELLNFITQVTGKKDELEIVTNTIEGKQTSLIDWSLTLMGAATFRYKYTTIAPIQMISTQIISNTNTSFEERQIIFDKIEWEKFLLKFGLVKSKKSLLTLETNSDISIDKIDSIEISSVFGSDLELHLGVHASEVIKIPVFNVDDESISTQRIIFT